ncbi:MAG: hypothetical protein HC822_07525 [Oscillochloris sp.]|nr:hypothetical protein [Oscillochloris sp.]
MYTRDYTYLGTIQRVIPGKVEPPEPLITDGAGQSSSFNGELRGPVPTLTLGNRGPLTQSVDAGYATAPDSRHLLGDGSMLVTHWWGLRGRYTIPLALI